MGFLLESFCYNALGLSPGASKDDIVEAYRRCEQTYLNSHMDPVRKAEWAAARGAYTLLVAHNLTVTDDFSRQGKARQSLRKPTPQLKDDSLRISDQTGTPEFAKMSITPRNLLHAKEPSQMPLASDKTATGPAKSKSPTNLPRQKETSQRPLAPNKIVTRPANTSSSPLARVAGSSPSPAISMLSKNNKAETWDSFQFSLATVEVVISKLHGASMPESIFYWSQFCSGMLVLVGRIIILSAPVPLFQRSGMALERTHESVLANKIHDLYLQSKVWHEDVFPIKQPNGCMAKLFYNTDLGPAVQDRLIAIIDSLDEITRALEQRCSSGKSARADTSQTSSRTFHQQPVSFQVEEAIFIIDRAMRNLLNWTPMIKEYCCPNGEDKALVSAVSAIKRRQAQRGDPLTSKGVATVAGSASQSPAQSAAATAAVAAGGGSTRAQLSGSSTTVDRETGSLPLRSPMKNQDQARMVVVLMRITRRVSRCIALKLRPWLEEREGEEESNGGRAPVGAKLGILDGGRKKR